MERFCGFLKPSIRNRRYPYASLDRFVTEISQLTQIQATYNLAQELSLRPQRRAVAGMYADPLCESSRTSPK